MSRPDESRYVLLTNLQADIIEKLASLLVAKDVPEGIVYLVGEIARAWDESVFEPVVE